LTACQKRERERTFLSKRDKLTDKNKVVTVLFLTEHNAMKAYWESGGIAPGLLDFSTRLR
jgi:hypothetical protein